MDFLTSLCSMVGYGVIYLALSACAVAAFGLMVSFMFAMISEASQRGNASEWQGIGFWCGAVGGPIWAIYGFAHGGIASTLISSLGLLVCMAVVCFVCFRICENRRLAARGLADGNAY